jgi:prepilin-type N-terminal cleavage/methylation domain-containing protein/prepilin-type processing-associated H-X9-DG protein
MAKAKDIKQDGRMTNPSFGYNLGNQSRFALTVAAGFTMVELLVCLAIVGVLLAMAIPAVQMVRESSRLTVCQNNLRQIGVAVWNYDSAHQRLPPGTIGYAEAVNWDDFRNRPDGIFWKNKPHTSFLVLVLPWLEENSVANRLHHSMFDLQRDVTSFLQPNGSAFRWFGEVDFFPETCETRIELYACPSDDLVINSPDTRYMGGSQPVVGNTTDSDGLSFLEWLDIEVPGRHVGTNYLGNGGAMSGGIHPDPIRNQFRGPMSSGERISARTIRDGLSNSILAGETIGHFHDRQRLFVQSWVVGGLGRGRGNRPWMDTQGPLFGNSIESSAGGFGSRHRTGICNFLFCDGSIRPLQPSIDIQLAYSLFGIQDGLTFQANF